MLTNKGEFYIIYAKRDGSLYKIFSKLEGEDKFKTVSKLKRKANGEKIKVGRYYDLKLEKFPDFVIAYPKILRQRV